MRRGKTSVCSPPVLQLSAPGSEAVSSRAPDPQMEPRALTEPAAGLSAAPWVACKAPVIAVNLQQKPMKGGKKCVFSSKLKS